MCHICAPPGSSGVPKGVSQEWSAGILIQLSEIKETVFLCKAGSPREFTCTQRRPTGKEGV